MNCRIKPGLTRAQNSEVVKSSSRAMCKITNNYEKNHQIMALTVSISTFMMNNSHLGTGIWP